MSIRRISISILLALIVACYATVGYSDTISVKDDVGNTITLQKPARRIISLAPHNTELLFAAGAGDKIVAAVSHSDYPPQAKQIRNIGNYNSVNMELLVQLKPHLIVSWESGNPKRITGKIKSLGFTQYFSEPRTLMDISTTIINLGKLAGTYAQASLAAEKFVDEYYELKTRYDSRKPVSVFYEIWNQPIMTVNNKHIINEVIEFCGGKNIFGDLEAFTPTVGVEAVIAANPDVIIGSSNDGKAPVWLDDWKQWKSIMAVQKKQLFYVNADYVHRHTPRILKGVKEICEILDKVRGNSDKGAGK